LASAIIIGEILRDLYGSQNKQGIFPYIASGCMWRVWGRGEVCTGFWWGSLRERVHWGDPDVDGRIILRGIFWKWEGVVGTGWSGLRGTCDYCNELSGSINARNFLTCGS
jgi:hypothetical protein